MSSDNVRTGFTSNWIRTDFDVMKPKEIGFVHPPRNWQTECFSTISSPNPISIINAPTGSGKSTMLSMLAYHRTILDNNKKTIIAVPQTVIGKGFKNKIFKLPCGKIVDWSVGFDLVSDSENTINQLIDFIKEDIFYSTEYPFERIAVCSFNTLRDAFHKLSPEEKQLHWNNLLICIDETHHLEMQEITNGVYSMNKLAQVIDYSYKNNNEIILVSATLFRGDQKGLLSTEILDNSIKYNLPFDKYMEDMKFLKSFSYDFIVDTNEYTKDIHKCINSLFSDGYNKLFIYIPHPNSYMSSGDKIREIQDILEQLKSNLNGDNIFLDENTGIYHITNSLGLDYKVCDLVSESLSKRTVRFVNSEIINKDKNSLDCIIALNRAKEGFDWEHANGMIVVGQRNSLTDVIQMVGRLLRDKDGKEKVKALHMLPFSPNQPTAPNLDNSLNDFFKAISISLLMEDVFAPNPIQTNDETAPTGQLSGTSSFVASSNIFDDLELDENQRTDLFNKAQKSLVNIAGGLVESQGTYSPEQLREQMPSIMKQWIEENNIEADEDQIEQLAKKVYNQFAKRTLQMQGINVSNIDWQMIESADPIEFTLRYVGKDTTLESLRELRRLIAFGESESNRKCHLICKRLQLEGYPSSNFVDDEGINHYNWIQGKKQAKQGNGELAWYDSDLKIAEKYGYPDLFDLNDNKAYFIQMTEKLIDFFEKHGRYPKHTEQELYGFHSRQKSYDRKCKYFDECLQYAISRGYPDIFKNITSKDEMILKINNLFQYVRKNGKPSSKDENKSYFYLIGTLRSCKQGKSENVWHDEYDLLFHKNDMWWLILSNKEISIMKTQFLINFILENNRLPSHSIKEEMELAGFASRKINGKVLWRPEEVKLINDANVSEYLICQKDRTQQKWLSDIDELLIYISKYDKLPSKKTHNKELNTLQECKRRFKNNDLPQIIIDKFIEHSCLNYLKFIDKQFEAQEKFTELCLRLQLGTRPSLKSSLQNDARLASYMSTLLKGLRGKRSFIKYDFYKQIAEEKKVLHFFEGLL